MIAGKRLPSNSPNEVSAFRVFSCVIDDENPFETPVWFSTFIGSMRTWDHFFLKTGAHKIIQKLPFYKILGCIEKPCIRASMTTIMIPFSRFIVPENKWVTDPLFPGSRTGFFTKVLPFISNVKAITHMDLILIRIKAKEDACGGTA